GCGRIAGGARSNRVRRSAGNRSRQLHEELRTVSWTTRRRRPGESRGQADQGCFTEVGPRDQAHRRAARENYYKRRRSDARVQRQTDSGRDSGPCEVCEKRISGEIDQSSLRFSAYLCVEMTVNAENAEIRRGPQRKSTTNASDRRGIELHRAVVHAPVPHHRKIFHVVLVQTPRCLRSLTWKRVQRAQDITRIEVDDRLIADVRIVHTRRAHRITVTVHVVQEPANILRSEIALQRPRRVCVANREREVRYVAEHHSLVDQCLRQVDSCVVDYELHSADDLEYEARGRHDDVWVELPAGFEQETVFGERLNGVGHDRRAAFA